MKPPHTLQQAASIFLEGHRVDHRESATRRLTHCFAALVRHIGEKPFHEIQATDVEAFKFARSKDGIKPITIRHDLSFAAGSSTTRCAA